MLDQRLVPTRRQLPLSVGRLDGRPVEHFYVAIRQVHIGAVIASGALMLLRGIAHNLWSARWANARPLRALSYTIDTVLLTAAVTLTTMVGQYPLADAWLTMKVMLLFLYITLGYLALRGSTRRIRWSNLGGAALVYALIISIARSHHPLGVFA